jgi:hypothetical protein
MMRASPLCVCAALAGTAHAQHATGPIDCFDLANNDLPDQESMLLCQGAVNDLPARCYQQASDNQGLALSNTLAVQLCAQATSEAPITCAAELEDENRLQDQDIVDYCQAQPYPVALHPYSGSTACKFAAEANTQLTQGKQVTLCGGSRDTAPVECFLAGVNRLPEVFEDVLIQLCAPVFVYSPEGLTSGAGGAGGGGY